MMSRMKIREMFIAELNGHAQELYEGNKKARNDCEIFAMRRSNLARLFNHLEILPDEAGPHLQIIYEDETTPKDDDDSRLIERTIAFIAAEYEKGKYDGRDAVGFFRTLLSRISDKLLLQFDEAYAK